MCFSEECESSMGERMNGNNQINITGVHNNLKALMYIFTAVKGEFF